MRNKEEWMILFENLKNGLASSEFVYGEIERENDFYEDELSKYKKVLKEANELLRTTSAIANREGKETNWQGFEKKIDESLKEQHELMYPERYEVKLSNGVTILSDNVTGKSKHYK